jgi:hydroxylamine reductase (hybrid-cluster protein)
MTLWEAKTCAKDGLIAAGVVSVLIAAFVGAMFMLNSALGQNIEGHVISETLRLKYQLVVANKMAAVKDVEYAKERLAAAEAKLNELQQAQVQACRDALASVQLELGKDRWSCAGDGSAVQQPAPPPAKEAK